MPDGSFRFQVSSFKKQRSCEFQEYGFKFQWPMAVSSFKLLVTTT